MRQIEFRAKSDEMRLARDVGVTLTFGIFYVFL